MPLQKLQFRPGINRESTNYSNEGGWNDCDKIRFRSGFPQKIGGWVQATGNRTFDGVCRMMINWVDLSNNNLIGLGTHLKYYVNNGLTDYNNITPIRKTTDPMVNNPFSTIDGSTTVLVTDSTHGAQVGDYVTFSGAVGFAGIATSILNAEHKITNIVDANSYEFQLESPATATTTGGGAVVVAKYQLNIGLPAYTIGNGFGAGVWNGANTGIATTLAYTSGSGNVLLNPVSTTINVADTTGFSNAGTLMIDSEIITYTGKTLTSFTGCVRGTSQSLAANHALDPTAGSAVPPPIMVYQVTSLLGTTGWGEASNISFGTGIGQQMRLWSNDTYGENLLINPRGGKIYYWVANTSTFPPAVELSTDVPIVATNQVIVSDVSRFIIAMGCNPYGSTTFDPLLVRWSDQDNPNVWDPTVPGSQAGDTRLSNGSYIVLSKKTRQEILIWTDAAVYSMQYLGPPYVFSFNLLMDNLSIMSPNAAIVVNNVAYWMGTDKFYSYTGRVETLSCSVRQYIFTDLNFDQRFQIISGTNEGFNEIWWYYVSNDEVAAAVEANRVPLVDKYVVYNHLENIWYYGSLRRTFWLDTPLQNVPLSAIGDETTGTLLFQETGVDDISTATPQPFSAYIQSSDFDIGDGHNFGFVWRIIPDISFATSGGNENNVFPSVTMEVRPRAFSGSPYGPTTEDTVTSTQPYGPIKQYTIEQYTPQVYTRIRGRQIAFKISSGGQLGVGWQLGSPRIDIRQDGRR
jgi:hypothetical protein